MGITKYEFNARKMEIKGFMGYLYNVNFSDGGVNST